MTTRSAWTKERRLGVVGLAVVVAGWGVLLCLHAFAQSVCTYIGLLLWPLLLTSLASLGAVLWAAVKDKWWWAIGLIPAILLLLSVLGTFEGC